MALPMTHILKRVCCMSFRLESKVLTSLYIATRGVKRYVFPLSKEMYHRRLMAGPVEETPRSSRINWNYDVELNAFASRISENISMKSLRQVLTDPSYDPEAAEVADILMSGIDQDYESITSVNGTLAFEGRQITEDYVAECLRDEFPHLPSEGTMALANFLLSTEKLSHISDHIGMKDIIKHKIFPIPETARANALLALIASLNSDQGAEKACAFIRDFILPQLIGEDIDEIYPITNAMEKLAKMLKEQGRGAPEPRLIDQLGQSTLVSCYLVGIYSDQKLLGKAPGETIEIAKDMAARDVLMTIYGIQEHRLPADFINSDKQHQSSSSV